MAKHFKPPRHRPPGRTTKLPAALAKEMGLESRYSQKKPHTKSDRRPSKKPRMAFEPPDTRSNEDKEIAWLEAQLGVGRSADWKKGYADDGLDDLFDHVDRLDRMFQPGGDNDGSDVEPDVDPEDIDDDVLEEMKRDGLLNGEFDGSPEESEEEQGSDAESASESDEESEDSNAETASESTAGAAGSDAGSDAEPSAQEADKAPVQNQKSNGNEGRYIPPAVRRRMEAEAAAKETDTGKKESLEQQQKDERLKRRLQGLVNRLAVENIGSIVTSVEQVYSENARAKVSEALVAVMLEIIGSSDRLGSELSIVNAALISALVRFVGMDLGSMVAMKCVFIIQEGLEHRADTVDKASLNTMAYLGDLYVMGVVSCVLIYDLIRILVDRGLSKELDVELLLKIVQRTGAELRHDDPSALKDIINLVKEKRPETLTVRAKFMLERLTDLKNNKIHKDTVYAESVAQLKKYLSSLNKRVTAPDPIRATVRDFEESKSRGKWWLTSSGWQGDPLAELEEKDLVPSSKARTDEGDALDVLAKTQHMNTQVRKSIFKALMSADDYADATRNLLQLGLKDVQRREIVRVILHCVSQEKVYNPYYALVMQRLLTESRDYAITMQYCLWDFFRELGEASVGGEKMAGTDSARPAKVSSRRKNHLAKIFGWCIGRGSLAISVLKAVPFGMMKPATEEFVYNLLVQTIEATQTSSPTLDARTRSKVRQRENLERVFVKAADRPVVLRGIVLVLQAAQVEDPFLKWAFGVVTETCEALV